MNKEHKQELDKEEREEKRILSLEGPTKDYEEQEIDICPDCGSELDGNVCNDCETKWLSKKFKEKQ